MSGLASLGAPQPLKHGTPAIGATGFWSVARPLSFENLRARHHPLRGYPVLDLRPPAPSAHGPGLAVMLLRQWPSYPAFVISFAFIGIMWINHHRLFTLIHRCDHTLNVALALFFALPPRHPTQRSRDRG